MGLLTVGVVGTSRKPGEHRLPLHPDHLATIDDDLRPHLLLERGYGDRFAAPDAALAPLVGGFRTREQLMAEADVLLLPKPTLDDLNDMRRGQVLWGWPHCVQDPLVTQQAIDKDLTLIAWEAMNCWTTDGTFIVHVFHTNNQLAGYSSVLHALTLRGMTGHYGRHLTAVVIGFGNTARGAINGLQGLGIHDVTVLTTRDVTEVASPVAGLVMEQLIRRADDESQTVVQTETGQMSTAEFIGQSDIVVNCVLQDTDNPLMFATNDEVKHFPPGRLIVDVSCDEGMGFEFARPTSFSSPDFEVGEGVTYYGVDHSPSYLWNSASWGISEVLIPYLRSVMEGPSGWNQNLVIQRAIEIREGRIQNPKILSFQGRDSEYPYSRSS